jgi:hypothetical protein
MNVVSADPRCTQVWANTTDGAYKKITLHLSSSQMFQLLFSSSTITTPLLQILIATKAIIIIYPDVSVSPLVL